MKRYYVKNIYKKGFLSDYSVEGKELVKTNNTWGGCYQDKVGKYFYGGEELHKTRGGAINYVRALSNSKIVNLLKQVREEEERIDRFLK